MALFKSYRSNSIVGLALEGRQLEGVVLQRSNGSLKASKVLHSTLSLDPLTNDSELVGREIRNHLDEAGLRERRCAMCIPLQWALTLQVKIPEIPAADVPDFLRLEAERGFPYAPDDLSISTSRYETPNGEHYASLIAVPKSHLERLEKTLRAARLKPVSFSLGITAVQEASDTAADGLLTLMLGEACVEMQVTIKGGVANLRTLEGIYEIQGAAKHVDAAQIAREIRITLGQLPKETRELVSRLRIFGPNDLVKPLIKELTPLARDMGLLVDLGVTPKVEGIEDHETVPSNASAALGLAVRHLKGAPIEFEFLPPKPSQFTQVLNRFSSGRVLYASATAGFILLVVGSLFFWQQYRLTSLNSEWRVLQPRVMEVDALQQQVKKFRSWYDESVPSLRIIRRLTEAFPEDGSVSAKVLEIKDLTDVNCSGQARDNPSLIKLMDQLRESKQITDLKVQQVRGKSPLLFNLSFRWSEGGQP